MVNAKLFLFTSTVVASVGIEPTKTRFLRPSAVPITPHGQIKMVYLWS